MLTPHLSAVADFVLSDCRPTSNSCDRLDLSKDYELKNYSAYFQPKIPRYYTAVPILPVRADNGSHFMTYVTHQSIEP